MGDPRIKGLFDACERTWELSHDESADQGELLEAALDATNAFMARARVAKILEEPGMVATCRLAARTIHALNRVMAMLAINMGYEDQMAWFEQIEKEANWDV